MTGYGIAKALTYLHPTPKERDGLIDAFLVRYERTIDDAVGSSEGFPKVRPTAEDIARFQKKLGTFKTVFRNNIPNICAGLSNDRNRKGNRKLKYLDQRYEAYKPDRRRVNSLIFNGRVQALIAHLAFSEAAERVFSDYRLVKEVKDDGGRFPELERIGERALIRFMTSQRIRYIPYEEQLQEGRLALWHAAQHYDAINFARFSTFAHVSLTNKFYNMLRMFEADKRRVHKMTVTAGCITDPQVSLLAGLCDEWSYLTWLNSARHGSMEDCWPTPISDPTLFRRRPVKDEEQHYAMMGGGHEVTWDNFPHMNEMNIYTASQSDMDAIDRISAVDEFWEKKEKGEVYTDDKGRLRPTNPSPLLKRFEDQININEEMPF